MASNSAPTQKPSEFRSKSCDTACSSNSSCFFQKRKPINPLANSLRSGQSRSTGNSVRQRVLSAKLLKLKTIQNQLNDANFHLAEVIRENQALKTLQKRQDKALTKYEGASAELPRLIQSHEEEIRFLTEKNKQLRKNIKELNEQIKHKNDELTSVQEQLRHYEKLEKDKRLLEREKLIEELDDVKRKLQKADGEIVILNRKLTLESKTSKQRLNVEMAKHKQCQKEHAQALAEINRLTKLVEAKDKSLIANGRRRFANLAQRQSTSLTSLINGTKHFNLTEISIPESNPVCDRNTTEVKLEPLTPPKKDDQTDSGGDCKGILKSPAECVKARLSADSRQEVDEELPLVDKLSLSGSDSSNEKEIRRSRPSSSQKLEKIEMNVHNTIRKIEDNKNSDEFSKRLGDYCLSAINSVKGYSSLIEHHKENLENAKEDTDKLMKTVKDAESLEMKLKHQQLVSFDSAESADNLDFVSQILKEEVAFQIKYPETKKKKEPSVAASDKKKLLATLRAIDNGDSVDSFDSGESKKDNHLIKELFSDVTD